MADQAGTAARVRFGPFELDLRSRELSSAGRRIRLQDQPFEILKRMIERPGEVVTREELRRRLWADGTTVDFEHSLNAAVKRLRDALGEAADRPRLIETLPRRGYRFLGQVEPVVPAQGLAAAARPPVRLVVLPFSNLSDDSAQEYFSDGLTEELIAQLGPALQGRIGVIARWSSMAFKGSLQRAREIGEALRVDYILEGSVRRDGARVRITVRLLEAASEAHLWSNTYEQTVDDWLSVQTDVAARVARSLSRELVVGPGHAPRPPAPRGAYEAYLKGRYYWALPGDRGLADAKAYLEQATVLAPDFATAHAALSRVLAGSVEYYRQVPRLALAAAQASATRALALDPSLSEAHATLGDVARIVDYDWRRADAAYAEASRLNPSSEIAPRLHGLLLMALGRSADAREQVDRALDIDPLCLVANTAAAWVRFASGALDAATGLCRHTLDLDQDFAPAVRLLAAAQLGAGAPAEAAATLERALERLPDDPTLLAVLACARAAERQDAAARSLIARARALASRRYVSPYYIGLAQAAVGDAEAALASLDEALVDRDPMIPSVAVDPRWAPLHGRDAFARLLERLRLSGRVGVG